MNGVAIKLEVNMEKAKIFQSIVKGSNFFTPIVDSYYTVGNHIVELSCSEKDNWRGRYDKIINGITFKGKYGVTVITNEGDGWKRSTELDKLCDSRDEAINNVIIRSKLYNLLNNVTSKFNDVTKATPHIVDFQNMSNDKVLEHYYLSIGAESLWNARELIIKAISEQNKLIREGYDEIY